jgi:hypothetical protein
MISLLQFYSTTKRNLASSKKANQGNKRHVDKNKKNNTTIFIFRDNVNYMENTKNQKRQDKLKELIYLIRQNSGQYKDPLFIKI